jgi:phosphoglycerate dehydrogenase-like enzyme
VRRIVINLRDTRPVWAIPSWAVDRIRSVLPSDWELVDLEAPADGRGDGGEVPDAVLDAVRGAEVYVGYGAPPALLRAATEPPIGRLRWVHSAAAGVGASLHDAMLESNVILTNSAGIHAPPIAETVVAMILHFARGLDFAVAAQARGEWLKEPFESVDTPVREAAGATLGILGFGGIGQEVARRVAALGMRVIAVRRRPLAAPDGVELLTGDDAMDRLLERSEFLLVSLPDTPRTRDLLGERQLRLLPAGAVVVNVARGAVLDQDALARLLAEGRLRGAALDVFRREPLPAGSPLWTLPNVLVMPHVSATSPAFWRRQTELITANVQRYLAGEPLLNTVDKHAGY